MVIEGYNWKHRKNDTEKLKYEFLPFLSN